MVQVGETIAVVDKSGKIISTSKHLLAVFKEAKSAYREKKATIAADRQAEVDAKNIRRAPKAFTIDDDVRSDTTSRASSRGSHRRSKHASKHHQNSGRNHDKDLRRKPMPADFHYTPDEHYPVERHELTRRHTTADGHELGLVRAQPVRTVSTPSYEHHHDDHHIDMDLAYGDIPPPLPPAADEEKELATRVSKITMLLDEAHCLQYTATSMIAHLQKNPDAMAAVALTLAEISNLVAKMAPGALTALKASSPAIFALLASPQFMIAAGAGVGITIVALGGYKIVKKIQARNAEREEPMAMAMEAERGGDDVAELQEIGGSVNNIEHWRRGIADVSAESYGTSVDGEFITPDAFALMRGAAVGDEAIRPRTSGGIRNADWDRDTPSALMPDTLVRSKTSAGDHPRRASSHRAKSTTSSHSRSNSKRGSKKSDKKTGKAEKKPSGLRLLFHAA
ncbi:MAG: hypothetical protein M1819_001757 [Sarea resinae]|nr:MAG: hypothetical protein M1819_001757 [Sarea resinae]